MTSEQPIAAANLSIRSIITFPSSFESIGLNHQSFMFFLSEPFPHIHSCIIFLIIYNLFSVYWPLNRAMPSSWSSIIVSLGFSSFPISNQLYSFNSIHTYLLYSNKIWLVLKPNLLMFFIVQFKWNKTKGWRMLY